MNIEKGIPVPPPKMAGVFKLVSEMEVGDSILCDNLNVLQTVQRAHRKHGFKYVSRSEGEKIRIWRAK